MPAGAVEGSAGIQIDRAGNTTFDHVGGHVLEHLDAAEKFRRNIREGQVAPVVGRKCVPTVQFRADECQATDDHARTFDREVVRVIGTGEPADRNTRHPLERLGHRAIRQRADVLGADGVDEDVRVFLDGLGAADAGANAGNDDLVDLDRVRILSVLG